MISYRKHKVLVAPLDWGLGHATRCIPIVRGLLNSGHEVVLGAEKEQAALLHQEFPQLGIIPLKGYRVRYSRSGLFFALKLMTQLPRIYAAIRQEHRWLAKIIVAEKITCVISDNRFGLYHATVPCFFITHQLTIKAPFQWVERLLRFINYRFINRFKACWVPDMAEAPGIAGVLSHPPEMPEVPVFYINLLSRFVAATVPVKYDVCILLSGPEPQRSLLEEKILGQVSRIKASILLVRGRPGDTGLPAMPAHVTVVNHLPGETLGAAIQQSGLIVSRSGYTTVMELLALQKKMILIPTPGQTEQEYLAGCLLQAGWAMVLQQDNVELETALARAEQFVFKQGEVQLFNNEKITGLIEN
ncbi:MAG TPA: glycosyltransferase [Sediminibacterium sp.]|nr:glycosyltransferase [Sediminibacterium sp.]